MQRVNKLIQYLQSSQSSNTIPKNIKQLFIPSLSLISQFINKVQNLNKINNAFLTDYLNSTLAQLELAFQFKTSSTNDTICPIISNRLMGCIALILIKSPKSISYTQILSQIGYASQAQLALRDGLSQQLLQQFHQFLLKLQEQKAVSFERNSQYEIQLSKQISQDVQRIRELVRTNIKGNNHGSRYFRFFNLPSQLIDSAAKNQKIDSKTLLILAKQKYQACETTVNILSRIFSSGSIPLAQAFDFFDYFTIQELNYLCQKRGIQQSLLPTCDEILKSLELKKNTDIFQNSKNNAIAEDCKQNIKGDDDQRLQFFVAKLHKDKKKSIKQMLFIMKMLKVQCIPLLHTELIQDGQSRYKEEAYLVFGVNSQQILISKQVFDSMKKKNQIHRLKELGDKKLKEKLLVKLAPQIMKNLDIAQLFKKVQNVIRQIYTNVTCVLGSSAYQLVYQQNDTGCGLLVEEYLQFN